MNAQDNLHIERFPWCNVVYWKGNSACRKYDDWDKAEVAGTTYSFPLVPVYKMAEDDGDHARHRLDSIIRLCELAYNRGQEAKAKEVRNVLLIKGS